jgi:hypothetical protein
LVLATNRKKKNSIFSLDIDDQIVYDVKLIIRRINEYYRDLLGTSKDISVSLSINFWSDNDKLSSSQIQQLVQPFTIEEVKKIIFSCHASKAPGPNRFSF